MGKYFVTEVKPTISAAQMAGNITNADILFDWFAFDVPKGPARLIGMTVKYAGKDGADVTVIDFECFFAKSYLGDAPTTLGGDGGAVDTFGHWFHQIIGKTWVSAAYGGANDGDLVKGNIVSVGRIGGGIADGQVTNNQAANTGLVMQGEPDSGTNVGYDKLYVAGISKGTANWASTMQIGTETVTTSPVVTVKTIDADIALNPGDIIKDEDGQLLGTIKSIDSTTQVTLEDNCANVSAVNKVIRNVTPITLIMSWEK